MSVDVKVEKFDVNSGLEASVIITVMFLPLILILIVSKKY